jgi:hypothetical protein
MDEIKKDTKDKEAVDLSKVLKNAKAERVAEEPEETGVPSTYYPGSPKMIQWMIKYTGGIVKDPKQANYVLIGLAILMVIFSIWLQLSSGPNAVHGKENSNDHLYSPAP